MEDMELLRKKIDNVDNEMKKLFLMRMNLVKRIKEYKKENNLPVYDKKREEEILLKNSLNLDESIKKYYMEFMKSVMDISKEMEREM